MSIILFAISDEMVFTPGVDQYFPNFGTTRFVSKDRGFPESFDHRSRLGLVAYRVSMLGLSGVRPLPGTYSTYISIYTGKELDPVGQPGVITYEDFGSFVQGRAEEATSVDEDRTPIQPDNPNPFGVYIRDNDGLPISRNVVFDSRNIQSIYDNQSFKALVELEVEVIRV